MNSHSEKEMSGALPEAQQSAVSPASRVRHAPMYPLPWATHGTQTETTIGGMEMIGSVSRPQPCAAYAADGPYIVHACNAYPKLVAALKAMREAFVSDAHFRLMSQQFNPECAACVTEFLLRELGEIE